MNITPKQKNVLDYITNFKIEKGFAPSQREIAEHFGFRSLGTVQDYLTQLEAKGFLEKVWNGKRALEIPTSSAKLPLLGRVAAGRPIEATLQNEFLDVSPQLFRKSGNHFALQVKGDSMIEEGILDGDYVIIRKQPTAENGEKVVALVNNEATIKKYFKRKNKIELHPANERYKPFIIEEMNDFKIEGVLVGLIRVE